MSEVNTGQLTSGIGVGVKVAGGNGVNVGGFGVGGGVGVSGRIRRVAARQANVEKRIVTVAKMSLDRGISLSGRDDQPAGIQKIQVEVAEEHDDPQCELDAVEDVLP